MRFHSQQILLFCLGQDQHAETKKKDPGRRQKMVSCSMESHMDPSTFRGRLGTQG